MHLHLRATPLPFFVRLVLTCAVVLALLLVGSVMAHPVSLGGPGARLLWLNLALLAAYAFVAIFLASRVHATYHRAFHTALRLGPLLAGVLVANDLAELFVRGPSFGLVIAPVLFAITILAAAGSATWLATRSTIVAVVAGVCCVLVAVPLFLSAAVCLHLTLSTRAELPLQGPFMMSGMTDPAAFLVQNILESASESLLRFPVFAVFLSLAGTVSARISSISSRARITVACLAPFLFAAGAIALRHANQLARERRPPLVLAGLALTVLALSSVHTMWSSLRRA